MLYEHGWAPVEGVGCRRAGEVVIGQRAAPVSVNIGKDEPSRRRYDEDGSRQATRGPAPSTSSDGRAIGREPWVSIGMSCSKCPTHARPTETHRGEEAKASQQSPSRRVTASSAPCLD